MFILQTVLFICIVQRYLAIRFCFVKVFAHHSVFAWLEHLSRSLYRFRQASASFSFASARLPKCMSWPTYYIPHFYEFKKMNTP